MSGKYIIGILIIIIIILGGVFLFSKQNTPLSLQVNQNISSLPQEGDITIRITEQGFSPAQTSIKQGQTVTWVNDDSQYHWPASNLHPTHTIYPEFDPREPIAPGESWSFQFTKVGTWRYHDHLRPIDRGVVEVVE